MKYIFRGYIAPGPGPGPYRDPGLDNLPNLKDSESGSEIKKKNLKEA